MGIKSDKEKRLEKYIKYNPASKLKQNARVELKGKPVDLPVYRIPIKLLTFNIENGRFTSDLLAEEAKQNRKLDPYNKKDSELIRGLLLNNNPKATKVLKEDLKRVGQMENGVVTSAGNVINANRRMACLIELKHETGQDKYDYLEAAILPPSADESDIWKLEAKLQYGKDLREDYSPINKLLKIKGAIDKGLDRREIAASLGDKVGAIQEFLDRLKLIESYLKHIGEDKNYKLIDKEGISEHFIDASKNINGFKADYSGKDLHDLVILHFEMIRAGVTHNDIRDLSKLDGFDKVHKDAIKSLDLKIKKKIDEDEFKEQIKDCVEISKIKNNQDKPNKLINHAYSSLVKVDELDLKLDKNAKKILGEIIIVAKRLK